mmetsp:Transcript_2894/g.6767  ORF Transcript_2894/g.6767 Transcript_2894/m.6767 type:complete len:496 (-) Transcript_2894:3430-4917(-)
MAARAELAPGRSCAVLPIRSRSRSFGAASPSAAACRVAGDSRSPRASSADARPPAARCCDERPAPAILRAIMSSSSSSSSSSTRSASFCIARSPLSRPNTSLCFTAPLSANDSRSQVWIGGSARNCRVIGGTASMALCSCTMRCLMCSSRLGGAPSGSSPNACIIALNSFCLPPALLSLSFHLGCCVSSMASSVVASVLTNASGSIWTSVPVRSLNVLSPTPRSRLNTTHCLSDSTSGLPVSCCATTSGIASGCSSGTRSAASRSAVTIAASAPRSSVVASNPISSKWKGSMVSHASPSPPSSAPASSSCSSAAASPDSTSSSQYTPWRKSAASSFIASSASADAASAPPSSSPPAAPSSPPAAPLQVAARRSRTLAVAASPSRTALPEAGGARAPSSPPKYFSTRYWARSCWSSAAAPEGPAPALLPRLLTLPTSPLRRSGPSKTAPALAITASMHRSTETSVRGTPVSTLPPRRSSRLTVCAGLASLLVASSR